MEAYAAATLDEFREGKISRRQLIEKLTLAVTAVASSGAKAAAPAALPPAPALKAALVNHVSYTCADFRKTADWYSRMFNLDQVGLSNTDVVLPFGKKGEKPYGVEADDVPLTYLIIRTHGNGAEAAPGKPKAKALINHIAYTIADYEETRVRAELKRMGYANPYRDGPHSVHIVDPNGFDVQISGIQMTALGG